jgi:hypothetical protein
MLGLGELTVRDRQRGQPRAGRLELLLQEDSNRRYEVEIELGATDEAHVIRALEYWDIELKFNKHYVGLARHGIADNFVTFKARRARVLLAARIARTDEMDQVVADSGLAALTYDKQWKSYRLSLSATDVKEHPIPIRSLIERAYKQGLNE